MILFSPVGTADPITALGDGPMLHIVRHYRPTVVTLFFSPAVATFEEKDGRYTKAIERLVRGTRVRIVETQQTQVHRFDLFVPEFRVLLAEFAEEFPGEEILLNTSSGTPAMQSALVAINAFGIPATKAIQVSTPSRSGINNPGDREHPNNYDLDLMWDADEDNLTGAVNRCFEATSAALGTLLQRQNLKELIKHLRLRGCVENRRQAGLPRPTHNFIEGIMCRASLHHDTAQRLLEGTEFAYHADPAAEYVAALDLLRRRKQWADFARAATPAIDAALKSALAHYLTENRYLSRGQLDRQKLKRQPQISDILRLSSRPSARYLSTSDRLDLLLVFDPRSTCRSNRSESLHRVSGIRPHTRWSPSALKSSRRMAALPPQELVDILARETDADLTIYDHLNSEIIRQIDAAPLG